MGIIKQIPAEQQLQQEGNMAQPTAPFTTWGDFVSDDTFFKNTWEDFDKMREGMFSESRDMWKRFDQDFRTRTSRSENMRESSQNTTSSVRNWSQTGRKESSNENVDMMNNNHQPRWGNGWMIPAGNSRGLDSFKTKDDDTKMEVSVDTSQYRPEELKVSVDRGVVTVEGKHEEKANDGSTMVSRMFSKKYTLPSDAKEEDVVSKLSSDGILIVTAPKSKLAIRKI